MDIDVDVLPLFRYDSAAEIRLRRAAAAWEHAAVVNAHASEPNVYRVRLDAPSGDEAEIEVRGRPQQTRLPLTFHSSIPRAWILFSGGAHAREPRARARLVGRPAHRAPQVRQMTDDSLQMRDYSLQMNRTDYR